MADLIPVIDFIHALRSIGQSVNYWEVVDRPNTCWERLSHANREALLEEMRLAIEPSAVRALTVVKRRGRAAMDDNVYLRISTEKGLIGTFDRARDFVAFQPYSAPPGIVVDEAPSLPSLPTVQDDELEEFAVPQSVFREASFSSKGRRVLEILDSAWGGTPYDLAIDGPLVSPPRFARLNDIQRYWVEEPFSSVTILRNEDYELVYHIEEPRLSELEKSLLITVNDRLRDSLIGRTEDPSDRERFLVDEVFDLLHTYKRHPKRSTAYKLGYYFVRNFLGFGRLEPIMRDEYIEDVSCNGPATPIYVVHAHHGALPTSLVYDEMELMSYTIKLAQRGGKLLSVAQPLVDATLPDGSRIQASLGREVTSRGSAFTIRKFKEHPLTCVDLIRGGAHTLDSMAFLWLVVEMQCNLVVMGATASGKTTTLNTLSQFIPPTCKIVSIEDTRELKLEHGNWLPAVTRETFTGSREDRISMFDLLRAALRQRPDYVLVGEIRGEEGLTLFQAMSTGHTCYSTMHAGNVENAVYRMENAPINVPRVMLTSLDFFLLQGQVDVKGRAVRRMLSLTEVNGIDSGSRNLRTNEIFRWDGATDTLELVSKSQALERARAQRGWSRQRVDEEFQSRRRIIERLVDDDERNLSKVARAIMRFYNRQEFAETPAQTTPPSDAIEETVSVDTRQGST